MNPLREEQLLKLIIVIGHYEKIKIDHLLKITLMSATDERNTKIDFHKKIKN